MKDKLDITLRIGTVRLSLNINRDEEAVLREVAKEVNHAFDSFRERFPKSDDSENMAKVTLLFARGYLNLVNESKQTRQLLGDFENRLDTLLADLPPQE